ncbi:GLPGLI family protein [Sphingobacterium sp. UT-1RO-CII-1]|uniref:GLPGLI family protein n=1 Tax=Sphingobacterium sp. UT-1RO-CII-1 TaxID=2995225 RepID=UPI00227BFE20|nr:GLPGLI family protein [Sphingobacterium sp. UT-1RO-CII-1]MCY4781190.1 GLPGLI family protein [Sphingobacterium sp. UT-1RO-CII-1]
MRICLLILSLLVSLHSSSQIVKNLEKRFIFRLDYKPDSNNFNRIETEFFFLDISEEQSVFRSESTHIKDSILNSDNPNSLMQTPKTQFRYTIVKNFSNNKIKSFHDYTTFKFALEEEDSQINWQVHNDNKDILGYNCSKATAKYKGREYTAYFAQEIPFSDGPYKFKGLPGMILQLQDSNNEYNFEVVGISNLKNYDYYLARHENYKTISKKELAEFEDKIKEKPSLILMNPGIQLSQEAYEKYDRNHRERNKSRNNPIELTRD